MTHLHRNGNGHGRSAATASPDWVELTKARLDRIEDAIGAFASAIYDLDDLSTGFLDDLPAGVTWLADNFSFLELISDSEARITQIRAVATTASTNTDIAA